VEGFVWIGKTAAVSGVARETQLLFGRAVQFAFALREVGGIEHVPRKATRARAEGITANRAAVTFPQTNPALGERRAARWIEVRHQFLFELAIAGRKVKFRRGPGDFVVVHEFVAVVADFLVSAVAAKLRKCALKEVPTFARFREIFGRDLRIRRFEFW
jgi:hypothetical protein